jgi:P4 family phage/plasmid primase-like protien
MENQDEFKLNFKNAEEIKSFSKMNNYEKAVFVAEQLKPFVKILSPIEGNILYYMYNIETKLWKCHSQKSFFGIMARYFNDSINSVKKYKKDIVISMTECDIEKDDIEKVKREFDKVIKDFDSMTFITTLNDRFIVLLADNEFSKTLNSIPYLFPLKNKKKINLKTLEVTERTQDDLFTFETNLEYKSDENADVNKYFYQLIPNEKNRKYLQKALGYMLTGETMAQVFFILYGVGENGKSQLMRFMNAILNDYFVTLNKSIMNKSSNKNDSGPSPEKLILLGKRLGVYSEGETADEMELNESMIKAISGEDAIECRGLFKDPISFYAMIKLCMLTNYIPPVTADKAMKRRLRYIFLDSQFSHNPKEGEFLMDKEFINKLDLSYVFSWIAKGAKSFYDNNCKLEMTTAFEERTNRLLELDDSIENFIKTKLIVTLDKKDFIRRSDIFEIYKKFCDENSQRCKPRSTLFNRFVNMKLDAKLHGYDGFRGLQVKRMHNDEDQKNDGQPSLFIKAGDKASYVREEEFVNSQNELNGRIDNLLESQETLHDEFRNAISYIEDLEYQVAVREYKHDQLLKRNIYQTRVIEQQDYVIKSREEERKKSHEIDWWFKHLLLSDEMKSLKKQSEFKKNFEQNIYDRLQDMVEERRKLEILLNLEKEQKQQLYKKPIVTEIDNEEETDYNELETDVFKLFD